MTKQLLSSSPSSHPSPNTTSPTTSNGQAYVITEMLEGVAMLSWPRGVTVSTLDSESSDRGSNPRETCCAWGIEYGAPVV